MRTVKDITNPTLITDYSQMVITCEETKKTVFSVAYREGKFDFIPSPLFGDDVSITSFQSLKAAEYWALSQYMEFLAVNKIQSLDMESI